jgi:hypothetical protein
VGGGATPRRLVRDFVECSHGQFLSGEPGRRTTGTPVPGHGPIGQDDDVPARRERHRPSLAGRALPGEAALGLPLAANSSSCAIRSIQGASASRRR